MSAGANPDLPPGTLVAGRYRVEAVIARGGMGVVYRAEQVPLGRAVALKVLKRELVDRPDMRARFEREARVASSLPHPSAVTIYDFGELPGAAYLAMELLSGPTLQQQLDEHPGGLPPARAIAYAEALADVLAAAHEVGLVHRDLTPSNVILEPTDGGETVRVLDFGLAFLLDRGTDGRLTREGVAMGTPDYLSPEQARGAEVGPPTDVYALGCVLHEMLTGCPPYAGSEMDVLTKQLFAPAPPLERPGAALAVPAALDALRRAMLDKVADRRPGAREVRDRLAALDPDPMRGRVRAREDGFLGARARRMVDPAPDADRPLGGAVEVGILGSVDAALLLGLSAAGLAPFVITAEEKVGPATRALFAPGIEPDAMAAALLHGRPVVADADRGDLPRLSALLSAGAADVVLRPVTAAELARKLLRVARDRR